VPRFRGELIRVNKDQLNQLPPFLIAAPPFENVACVYPYHLRPTKEEIIKLIESGRPPMETAIRFYDVSPISLAEAVEFLRALQVEFIDRPYLPRSEAPHWIWSGYGPDALRHNMRALLVDVFEEYSSFIDHNQISIKRSRHLNPDEAIIYVADFEEWGTTKGPIKSPLLEMFVVGNQDHKLPKATLIDRNQPPMNITPGKKQTLVDGIERKTLWYTPTYPDDLFKSLPMLNRIYSMLKDDLQIELKQSS